MLDEAKMRPGHRVKRLLIIAVVTGVVGYALATLVGYFIQERVVFPAWAAGEGDGVPPHASAERVVIDTEVGEIAGWFVAGLGVSADEPGPGVMFLHGNAELAEDQRWIVDVYRPMGVSVLLPEYRGYGGRPGVSNERTLGRDVVAWWALLGERAEVDAERLAVHGRSIGGAVAGTLMRRRRPAGVVVESTPTSIAAMVWRHGLPGSIMPSRFRTDRSLADYDGPVLVMHGRDDDVIPFSHGRRLAERAGGADAGRVEFVAFDARHADLPRAGEQPRYREAVRRLIDRLPAPAGGRRGGSE
jgi:pimeloyl-ACP methyl ester carboxylesterase